jgi:hypothetical protein
LELMNSPGEVSVQISDAVLRWLGVSCRWFDYHWWGIDVDTLGRKYSLADSSINFWVWENPIRWKTYAFRWGSATITAVVPAFSIPVAYRLITRLLYCSLIRKSQVQQTMRAPGPSWAPFLLSVTKGKTNEIQDWRELQRRFHVFVTKEISIVYDIFCDGLEPHDHFPLGRQWIYATNKFVNQINRHFQQWRTQEARPFGIISAFTQLTNHYSIAPDCPKLSKSISSRKLIHLTCLQMIYPFWKGIRSFWSKTLTPDPGW